MVWRPWNKTLIGLVDVIVVIDVVVIATDNIIL